MADRAADRSGSYRDDPPRPPRRKGLDQHLPGQARDAEAGRDPHGLGQGQPGEVGRGRQAGPHHVRAVVSRCRRGSQGHRPGHPETADQGALYRTRRGLLMAIKEEREEIHSLSDSELVEQIAAAKDNLFKLRFKRATGQLEDFSQLPKAKHTVARLMTEVRAREIAAAEGTTK